MIALIIIGSLVLLIVILLVLSVSIEVNYEHSVFDYKIKYMFFTIIADPESPRHKKKREKKEAKRKRRELKKQQKAEKSRQKAMKKRKSNSPAAQSKASAPAAEKSAPSGEAKPAPAAPEKKEKPSFDFDMIKRVITGASPHVKRIFKRIRIYELYIDAVVGGEDAAKVAINYGIMNAFINGVLCFLDSVVKLEVGEINIEADFDKEKSDIFAHAKLKLRLSTLLHSGIWGFLAVFRELHADTENSAPAAKQKSGKAA